MNEFGLYFLIFCESL